MATRRAEVLFLIGERDTVLYAYSDDSPVSLADSRERFLVMWRERERLVEIAHSHPVGPLAFSGEDERTMEAIAGALGREVTFSVIAPTGMLRRQKGETLAVVEEPWWAALLRRASGLTSQQTRRR